MKWRIVTDSSCDYLLDRELPEHITISEVPFSIIIGKQTYVDTSDLDISSMIKAMDAYPEASQTACPSPGEWYNEFEKADFVIAITISGSLSGSYNSAIAAREMILEKYPYRKIFVLDSRSAGSVLTMYVEKLISLIEDGLNFDEVVSKLKDYAVERNTVFALASYKNLAKNGRVSKATAFIAGKLGIWGIGIASDISTIIVKKKVRGISHVVNAFLEDMRENSFSGEYVVISHCMNAELAEKLKVSILKVWNSAKIKILEMGGLCSYYAEEKGMIVSY